MKKYKVKYTFEGNGEVEVMAKNKEEAKEMFFQGDFDDEEEWGEEYELSIVELVNETSHN